MAAIAKPAEFDNLHQKFITLFDSVSKSERIILLREMMVRPVEWFKVFLRWWFYEQPSFLGENLKIYTQCMTLVQDGDKSKLSAETKASVPMYLWNTIHNNVPAKVMWDAYFLLGASPGTQYIWSGSLLFVYDSVPPDASAAVPKRVSRFIYGELFEDLECDEFKHEIKEWNIVFPQSTSFEPVNAYLKYLDTLQPLNHSGLTYTVSDATRIIASHLRQKQKLAIQRDEIWYMDSQREYLNNIKPSQRKIIIKPAVYNANIIKPQSAEVKIEHTPEVKFDNLLISRFSTEYYQCVECCLHSDDCAITGAVRCISLEESDPKKNPNDRDKVVVKWAGEVRKNIQLVELPNSKHVVTKEDIQKALENTIALFQGLTQVSVRLTGAWCTPKLLFLVALMAAYFSTITELNFFYQNPKREKEAPGVYGPIQTNLGALFQRGSITTIEGAVDYIKLKLNEK